MITAMPVRVQRSRKSLKKNHPTAVAIPVQHNPREERKMKKNLAQVHSAIHDP